MEDAACQSAEQKRICRLGKLGASQSPPDRYEWCNQLRDLLRILLRDIGETFQQLELVFLQLSNDHSSEFAGSCRELFLSIAI